MHPTTQRQRNISKIKALVCPINSYCDCEFLKLNNAIGTFSKKANTILNYTENLGQKTLNGVSGGET